MRDIHVHLAMVLSTGILMWAYTFLALLTISSPVPGIIGLVCSVIHALSPLLFLKSNRSFLISNIAIGAGIIHQMSFSFFTGGYNSSTLKWLSFLPMLSGVCCGKRGAITWFCITVTSISVFLGLELSGFQFPDLISPTGILWGHSLLMYGWIFLSTVMILVLLTMQKSSEDLLQEQSKKIDELFRVLFHDLANSLGRINIGLSISRKQNHNPQGSRGIEIAAQAAESMMEITSSVRRMYAVSKGKAEVDLTATSLNDSVEYLQKVFASELDKKQLRINYDFDKYQGVVLMVEPVSFKNQVLGNIISNAIKFSYPGSEIKISSYPLNESYHAVEIRDYGIGMPEELKDQMFDLTKKTSRPGTSGEYGTGFGMHIMKSFVEMYHGQVLIESVEEKLKPDKKGTTFKLLLKGKSA